MTDRGIERLAAELRRWAERPTDLSPRAARTRVLAHLQDRRRRPSWRLVAGGGALAAGALALVLIAVLTIDRPSIERPDEPVASDSAPAAETGQPTIVHQLSSGTKLYIVMRPDALGDES